MMVVHSDASHAPDRDGIGVGWVIKEWSPGESPSIVSKGNEFIRGDFTSVEAECMALIRASREALRHTTDYITFYCDCSPVVEKITNGFKLTDDGRFLRTWKIYQDKFSDNQLFWVPRENNTDADTEARKAFDRNA